MIILKLIFYGEIVASLFLLICSILIYKKKKEIWSLTLLFGTIIICSGELLPYVLRPFMAQFNYVQDAELVPIYIYIENVVSSVGKVIALIGIAIFAIRLK